MVKLGKLKSEMGRLEEVELLWSVRVWRLDAEALAAGTGA